MRIALNGLSALRAWRAIRSGKAPKATVGARVNLPAPDPSPAQRWTPRAFDLGFLGLETPSGEKGPLAVAVPEARLRIRTAGVACTTYTKLPEGAFVEVGGGVALACPELVYLEMGAKMDPMVQLLLGCELCGTYGRDPDDPRNGEVTFGLEPLTTPERIADFSRGCGKIHSAAQSRDVLPRVIVNAWSPMEALAACLLTLDNGWLGYDLGPVALNPRVSTADDATRVPDILFDGTHLGINYDGSQHLEDRDRLVDDKRRTRELLAAGYTVLPMTSEDLSREGAFDALVLQLMDFLEREEGRNLARQRAFLAKRRVQRDRQKLIWSLMPGERGKQLSREKVDEKPAEPRAVVDAFLPMK